MGEHKLPRTPAQEVRREMDLRKLTMNYGHTGTHVVVQFSVKIANINLTEQQVDAMIDGLQGAKAALMEYRAAQARNGGPGHG